MTGDDLRVMQSQLRTPEQIRDLILKLARENDWGYTRILGELKKLGITPPSRNTLKNILKANGLEPGPKRGAGTRNLDGHLLSAGYGFDVGNLAPLPAMFSSSPSNVDDLVLPVPFAWEEGLQVIRLEPDGKVDGAF